MKFMQAFLFFCGFVFTCILPVSAETYKEISRGLHNLKNKSHSEAQEFFLKNVDPIAFAYAHKVDLKGGDSEKIEKIYTSLLRYFSKNIVGSFRDEKTELFFHDTATKEPGRFKTFCSSIQWSLITLAELGINLEKRLINERQVISDNLKASLNESKELTLYQTAKSKEIKRRISNSEDVDIDEYEKEMKNVEEKIVLLESKHVDLRNQLEEYEKKIKQVENHITVQISSDLGVKHSVAQITKARNNIKSCTTERGVVFRGDDPIISFYVSGVDGYRKIVGLEDFQNSLSYADIYNKMESNDLPLLLSIIDE